MKLIQLLEGKKMGTLFQQPIRNRHRVEHEEFIYVIEYYQRVSKQTGVSLEQVIQIAQLETANRAIEVQVSDNDIKDEQLAGFGELIQHLASAIEDHTFKMTDSTESIGSDIKEGLLPIAQMLDLHRCGRP